MPRARSLRQRIVAQQVHGERPVVGGRHGVVKRVGSPNSDEVDRGPGLRHALHRDRPPRLGDPRLWTAQRDASALARLGTRDLDANPVRHQSAVDDVNRVHTGTKKLLSDALAKVEAKRLPHQASRLVVVVLLATVGLGFWLS